MRSHRLALFGVLLASAACSKDVPINEETQKTIGPAGGTTMSAAEELRLDFPPGALPMEVLVRVTTDRNSGNLIGPKFDLKTEPPLQGFAMPVHLLIRAPSGSPDVELVQVLDDKFTKVAGATYDRTTREARG